MAIVSPAHIDEQTATININRSAIATDCHEPTAIIRHDTPASLATITGVTFTRLICNTTTSAHQAINMPNNMPDQNRYVVNPIHPDSNAITVAIAQLDIATSNHLGTHIPVIDPAMTNTSVIKLRFPRDPTSQNANPAMQPIAPATIGKIPEAFGKSAINS